MSLTIGSLCSGYGGLDMAVEEFFGAQTRWLAEFEDAPSRVLARHCPRVPNLGDMTKIDWSTVDPVDIVAGGTPCQDLSTAGKRKGMTEGTRSNLWVQMRECIAAVKPKFVIWENVRGAYSAHASSEVEQEPGLLGESYGPDRPALRALGRVLGDLSELGFDAEWAGVRAADAGAPHGRYRVFVLAYAEGVGRPGWCESWPDVVEDRPESSHARASRGTGPGTADAASVTGSVGHGDDVRARWGAVGRAQDAGPGAAANAGGEAGELRPGLCASEPRRLRRGRPDHVAVETAADAERFGDERRGVRRVVDGQTGAREGDRGERQRDGHASDDRGAALVEWGAYEPAIRRWERVLERVAPAPTEPTGKGGAHRLSPRFVEWMMGLPEGHVTGVEGITRNEELRMLGNGVVPQQALLALGIMWPRVLERVGEVAA